MCKRSVFISCERIFMPELQRGVLLGLRRSQRVHKLCGRPIFCGDGIGFIDRMHVLRCGAVLLERGERVHFVRERLLLCGQRVRRLFEMSRRSICCDGWSHCMRSVQHGLLLRCRRINSLLKLPQWVLFFVKRFGVHRMRGRVLLHLP